MRSRFVLPRAIVSLAAAAALSACAGHSGGALLPNTFVPTQLAQLARSSAPPDCKGEKVKPKYSSATVTLKTSGGTFCIPAFGGFGGSIEYPSANPAVKLKLISSTTDYDHKLTPLGTGTAIFYLQLSLSGGTSFGTNLPAGGGLAGKKIVAAKTYTAFGEAGAFGIVEKFKPCYLIAKTSKYGGIISGLGTLLKGVNTEGIAVQGFIEIYPGKQAKSKC